MNVTNPTKHGWTCIIQRWATGLGVEKTTPTLWMMDGFLWNGNLRALLVIFLPEVIFFFQCQINRSFCIKRIRPTKKINPNRKWEKMVEVFLWPLSSLFLRQSRVVISPWPERQSVLSGCLFFTTGHSTSRFSACLQSKLKEYEPGDQSTNKMQMNNQGGRFWWGKKELHPNLYRKFLLRTELFFCFERHLPNKTTTAYDLCVLVCFAGFWIY